LIIIIYFLALIGDKYGWIQVFNENLELVSSFQAHTSWINRIKQLPNGLVVTSSSDSYALVKMWDPTNNAWNLVRTYSDHTPNYEVWALEYLGNNTIASASASGVIQIWSTETAQTIKSIYTGSSAVSLKLLSNGYHLACGLGDGDIYIFNINDESLVQALVGHTSAVNDLPLLSNDLLASSSGDGTICIWNLTTYTNKFTLTGHTNQIYGLKQISNDVLASTSYDTTIKFWNITSGSLIRTLTGHASYIQWSIDLWNSQTLLTGSYDKTIKVWNVSTGELIKTIQTNLTIDALTVLNSNSCLLLFICYLFKEDHGLENNTFFFFLNLSYNFIVNRQYLDFSYI
jgi:WD40 repeat protein